MTLEEVKKLRKILRKIYIVRDCSWCREERDGWTAHLKDKPGIIIVDYSYNTNEFIKYRIKNNNASDSDYFNYLDNYRVMNIKDISLEEILNEIGNVDKMKKNWVLREKMEKIEKDF